MRSLASALLWCFAAWAVQLAEAVKPQAKRIVGELDGLVLVPGAVDCGVKVPAVEWKTQLEMYAAFIGREVNA